MIAEYQTQVTVRMPETLRRRLELIGENNDRSLSEVVRILLERASKHLENKDK